MRIETDDWVTVAEAAVEAKLDGSVARRMAQTLGLSQQIFGVWVIKRTDIATLAARKGRTGNPRWIEDYDEAASAAVKAVASRMKKKKKGARP